MINLGVEENFNLFKQDQLVGTVNIATKFTPEGTDQYEDAKKKLED